MFERFSDRARRVVVLADGEARRLHHDHIGPEHLLLGILVEDEGVASAALRELAVDAAALRQELETLLGPGDSTDAPRHIPFRPETKKALELSLREAQRFRHGYIGTEHLLLGVIAEDGAGARLLAERGVTLDRARTEVEKLLGPERSEEALIAEISREPRLHVRVPMPEIRGQLREISQRLAAIERKLGIEPEPRPEGSEDPAGG